MSSGLEHPDFWRGHELRRWRVVSLHVEYYSLRGVDPYCHYGAVKLQWRYRFSGDYHGHP